MVAAPLSNLDPEEVSLFGTLSTQTAKDAAKRSLFLNSLAMP